MIAAPEVTTADAGAFTAGNGAAVLQHHAFTAGVACCAPEVLAVTDGDQR
jgi:hypothetical protein